MTLAVTTQPTTCPSWCMLSDHDNDPDHHLDHFGPVVDGERLSIELGLLDDPGATATVFLSCMVPTIEAHLNDGWKLPAEPALLRAMAADLLTGADAVERAL